jgi:uncharacterized membrane protein
MAELSADAQAIVDRLKREGDLSRNSGTHSIRSVKIELSKFQDIFKTISTNIATQAEVLKVQTNLAKEAAEKAETQEQFKEIEPPQPKYEKDVNDEPKSKLVSESENKKINAIGDAIASALSFKNLALAAAGLFVGYNFLKGFIDEKTGGGFTEFEKNIGPFAKSLPGIGTVLNDFPKTLGDMRTSIEKMEKSIIAFTGRMNSILDNLTLLGIATAVLSTVLTVGSVASLAKTVLEKFGPKTPGASGASTTVPSGTNPTTTPEKTTTTTKQEFKRTASGARVGNLTGAQPAPQPSAVSKAISRAQGIASKISDNYKNAIDVERSITDPRMRKVFTSIVKGLGALSIALNIYQAVQLVALIDDPNSTQQDKQAAVGAFLGTLIGVPAVGMAGAAVGAFGGPWGALIGGVIGAGLGALGGAMIGEYIARWAFGESQPSQEDIDKKNRQIGIDQYLDKVDARPEKPMNRGTKGFGERAKAYADWNAKYGETHNPDGTPKASLAGGTVAGGRGNVVEKPGEREAYAQQLINRDAAAKKEINKIIDSVLVDAPGSMLTGNINRRNGLNTVSNNGGSGGGAVIINAPVSAPSSINMTNGGSSVNQLSISGGGGAGVGPSMLPYGLTNAYN